MAFRMIFMGSDPIALPALGSIVNGRCGEIELLAIYTQPDRPRGRGKKVVPNEIKVWATERGITVRQPEKMSKAVRLEIEAMGVDSILVMAYGHLLSQALIDTPRFGIWNLHTSILPNYRGASPIQCAVAQGDEETGDWLLASIENNIELIFFKMESRPGNTPIVVFDLSEGGIDNVVEGLAEKGATIVTPVSHAPGGWSAEFADPDGHVLSVYQSEERPRRSA